MQKMYSEDQVHTKVTILCKQTFPGLLRLRPCILLLPVTFSTSVFYTRCHLCLCLSRSSSPPSLHLELVVVSASSFHARPRFYNLHPSQRFIDLFRFIFIIFYIYIFIQLWLGPCLCFNEYYSWFWDHVHIVTILCKQTFFLQINFTISGISIFIVGISFFFTYQYSIFESIRVEYLSSL